MLLLSFQNSLKRTQWLNRSVTLLFLCVATNSFAVTQQSIILPLSFEHETNPRFSSTDEQSINRAVFVPNYSLVINKGTEQLTAAASLRMERSSDQTISEDRNDPSLNLGWQHDYETGQFGVTALIHDQSTRVSEFTDSGLVSGDNTRKTRSLSVNWLNSLSERTSLTLTGDATDVTFNGEITTGLVDYRNESMLARFGYTHNEKAETFTQFSIARYKPEDINNTTSQTKSFDVGVTLNVNERLNMTASAGINETEIESDIQNASNDNSWQASLNMQYATLRTNSHLNISRSQIPSSTGTLNETYQAAASWTYNLSERDNIAFGLNWSENLSLNKTITKDFSVNYTKAFSLSWDLRLSAVHRSRDDNITSVVSSTRVMASIIYHHPNF